VQVACTKIPEVKTIDPLVFEDSRGFFFESFSEKKLAEQGILGPWVQDNHSRSVRGALRGLHYQVQHTQGKLVRVAVGQIFDVAVDIRKDSATFGQWVGEMLSAANHRIFWVPKGFAHGFLTLSDSAEVLYKTTDYYAPEHERSILWNDPEIGIKWPLQGIVPQLSEKDRKGTRLSESVLLQA